MVWGRTKGKQKGKEEMKGKEKEGKEEIEIGVRKMVGKWKATEG